MIYISNIHKKVIRNNNVVNVYCGRPKGNQPIKYGNPHRIIKEGDRDKVCDLFEKDFPIRMEDDEEFKKDIYELLEIAKSQDIELLCFCAPCRCHTETLKRWLDYNVLNFKLGYITQPFEIEDRGLSFKQNTVVDHLFNIGLLDLNEAHVLPIDKKYYNQLRQLIGYSLSDYLELSNTEDYFDINYNHILERTKNEMSKNVTYCLTNKYEVNKIIQMFYLRHNDKIDSLLNMELDIFSKQDIKWFKQLAGII